MIFRHKPSGDIFSLTGKKYCMIHDEFTKNNLKKLEYNYPYKNYIEKGILVQLSPTNIWSWADE